MAVVKTIKVYSEAWPEGVLINESDFDPSIHRKRRKNDNKNNDKRVTLDVKKGLTDMGL